MTFIDSIVPNIFLAYFDLKMDYYDYNDRPRNKPCRTVNTALLLQLYITMIHIDYNTA